ncbi:hypothetical protein HZF08_05020 [Paenibacillus sp. CGMCC 1.16610]|uniref:Intracellular proteinase inhibitor BsuPI domain-containing protein n=1 Tax=Paenibacillus anseongense TaxID=2682845 RepID=A0ABW9U9D7_9BACL|nr:MULTISPECIES: hypothetical protein [Paenibacillus]MBA2937656.1 hypothetical protein [Paenibacillus sp. CGMCC 1.16610]MVQ36714.1 hypothetical protein [Paenibacillus anseongense]
MKKLFILIAIIIILGACSNMKTISLTETSPVVTESTDTKESIELKTSLAFPNEDIFSTTLTAPEVKHSNEIINVEAILNNSSDDSFTIDHASGVFYFIVKDKNGKQVNTFVMPLVAKSQVLLGHGKIIENYTFKIEKAETYEISATAKFKINHSNIEKLYEIETKKIKINIIN